MHHALLADKKLSQTKEEAEREKPNWAKAAEAGRSREAHDHEFHQALNSPRHFGVFISMPNVLGEPDHETVKSFEEAKAEERERNKTLPDESKVYFLQNSILARAVKEAECLPPPNFAGIPHDQGGRALPGGFL